MSPFIKPQKNKKKISTLDDIDPNAQIPNLNYEPEEFEYNSIDKRAFKINSRIEFIPRGGSYRSHESYSNE